MAITFMDGYSVYKPMTPSLSNNPAQQNWQIIYLNIHPLTINKI